jgi:hypothetical protein
LGLCGWGGSALAISTTFDDRITGASRPARAFRPLSIALVGALLTWGAAEALLVFLRFPSQPTIAALDVAYGTGTAAIILFLSRAEHAGTCPAWATPTVILGSFLVAALLAQVALESFPSSADEYGYRYLADTLLHGRLWNPSRPSQLHDVLRTFYIADHDGKRVSQYPPGWPGLLAGFVAIGVPQLANPAVGLLACVFLWLALRQLPIPAPMRFAALALGAAAPFALFNAASYFNHPLTAACILAIIWLDLRDGRHPSAWNRAGIGFAFSVLLTTRYEDFAIAFALFALDGLIRRRWRFIPWALPAAAAAAPLTALLLFYDWRITGSPFETSLSWAFPEIGIGLGSSGIDGPHSAWRGLMHTIWWALDWQNFASVVMLPLYGVALYRRIAARALRWFDLLLPALAGFFFFYPDGGGFQFGPRYWYFGYMALPVTIAAGLASPDGLWRVRGWRFDPVRLAMVQLAAFLGFTLGLAVFCHMRTEVRMLPLRVAATAPAPAIVLLQTGRQRYSSVQWHTDRLDSLDLTRNGLGPDLPPVLMGNDLGQARTDLLCGQLPDRHVFRLILRGAPPTARLQPACPDPPR